MDSTRSARPAQVDHLVVTAPRLQDGAAWLESMLGVAPQAGGEHPLMGTHNALLRLGDSLYLEVIAPNPAAAPPSRPRWFELDRLAPNAAPRLATWVARTYDIRGAVAACRYAAGTVEAMSRGRFRWLITIPGDGSLACGGAIPTLIEWAVDDHPAAGLADQGCSLHKLEVFSTESNEVSAMLDCLGLREAIEVNDLPAGEPSHLVADIQTPGGVRRLR